MAHHDDAFDMEATRIRALPSRFVLAPGGCAGKYEIVEKVGHGTFGLVFVARDTELDRNVAFKVLNPVFHSNDQIVARFLQEARATARIRHAGIVTVLDVGRIATSTGDAAYIAMELLEGESLNRRLGRVGRLAPENACEIARQIAGALDAAHRVDVLHRDLKPENIVLVRDDATPSGERVKVIDFGLAKLEGSGVTSVHAVFGTPRYMSPEQCRSATQIDGRSDIYALGCMLFELVTGRTPFTGDLRQLLDAHQVTPAPRASSIMPGIPAALDDLIAAMLAKDPAARPQTMLEVQLALSALGALQTGVAVTLMPTPAEEIQPVLPVRRSSPVRAALIATVILTATLSALAAGI